MKFKIVLLMFCALFSNVSSGVSVTLERFENMRWIEPSSNISSVLEFPELVDDIYRQNNDMLVWYNEETVSQFEFQLDLIDRAKISSLFSHQLRYLRYYKSQGRWFEYDLLATDTLILYLSYSQNARENGKLWFFDSKVSSSLLPPSTGSMSSLIHAVKSAQLPEFIANLAPPIEEYSLFLSSYQHLESQLGNDVPSYYQIGLKREGDTLVDRSILLDRLAIVGLDLTMVDESTNQFDRSLVKVVKLFQHMHGLKADGIIGSKTLKWLNLSPKERIQLLAINAERSRMWPKNRESIIMVNVPDFNMSYWYQGQEVFESKVVVGRKSRKTPLMEAKLDSVIMNPTWNVPWKIMVKDIIPKVKRDPEYLVRNNFQIIEGWNSHVEIDPAVIDWATVNPNAFPYRMRQLSGDRNALGLYKFNTPNKRAIYLHDTPSKNLFNSEVRAFSSGCIRVEHADKFASLLLETQGVPSQELLVSTEEPANTSIRLKRRIPVHIIYQTVWFEGGQTHYRDDIYHYDEVAATKG
ncbi:L,D-transpeptidase family protein [Vibrio genomosp. F6]|uniref:Peptidase n=1 Tax=Vibrio genomosp. F6 str. FF-238 TaxID=1191298 RepID=A0A1E5D384_9VIBR|nr:L,D-transpeptidase family protein [Vibrio genomosp. F6]OEE78008.1 peptidase [Vibrio genomosp. F6 str. FF-238]